jgi:hypothetical protein
MGYCIVDDVAASFPRFVRNAAGSISDTQIQGWIDDHAARIRSTLLLRGIDPATMTLTTDQTNFLRSLNRDAAIAELGSALEGNVLLQPGEYSLAAARRRSYETVLADIKKAAYDQLFGQTSRLVGTAGAETDTSTPEDRAENRSFGKNQVF